MTQVTQSRDDCDVEWSVNQRLTFEIDHSDGNSLSSILYLEAFFFLQLICCGRNKLPHLDLSVDERKGRLNPCPDQNHGKQPQEEMAGRKHEGTAVRSTKAPCGLFPA